MKILLMGDASGYHATLARALRAMGHVVTVASSGNYWMNTSREVDLARRPGRLGGALLWARLHTTLSSQISGYDVVSLAGCDFVDLQPDRILSIFRKLRRKNGSIFLNDLSTDTPFVRMCTSDEPQLPYSEWRNPDGSLPLFAQRSQAIKDAWLGVLLPLCREIYDTVDGVTTALLEYHVSAQQIVSPDRLRYVGIPIDLEGVQPVQVDFHAPQLRIFMGMQRARALEKGADRFEIVVDELLRREANRFGFHHVENVPIEEYRQLIRSSHIVLDQVYSLTPATNASQAMARGQVVVSGGEQAYYDFIGEDKLHPIINIVPGREQECVDQLIELERNRDRLVELSEKGIAFVKKHNDARIVAARMLEFWEERMGAK